MTDGRDERGRHRLADQVDVRGYRWQWTEIGDRRRGVPWIGIFLVVFGALLLLEQALPELETAGSLLFLAVGLAFLLSWLVNRGTGALYAGAIITALAAPNVLEAAHVVKGPGLGTTLLGIAFLLIAVVRAAGGGGWGWQAAIGLVLAAIGGSQLAVPNLGNYVWPALLVVGGLALIVQARRA
jgi:hypothetical protein